MSKNDMVMVPREWLNSVALLQMPLEELQDQAVGYLCEPCDEPDQHHQGEPVALPERKIINVLNYQASLGAEGWNACLDEIAKLGPLYTRPAPAKGEPVAWMARAVDADGTTYRQCVSTNELTERDAKFAWGEGVMNRCSVVITRLYTHADPGEVRVTKQAPESLKSEARVPRSKLVERDELLWEAMEILQRNEKGTPEMDLVLRISQVLSAFDPSIDGCAHSYANEVGCPECGEAFGAEPSAPKCEACKGNGVIGWTRGQTPEQFEQGESPCEECNATGLAPVDRDERAEFEVESLRNNRPVDRLPSGEYLLPATRFAWQGWQSRAALERKP